MGYRSDVKLIITNDNKHIKTSEIMNKLGKEAKEYFKGHFSIVEQDGYPDKIFFEADDVKWYTDDPENYAEIDDIENWISWLDDYIEKIGEDKAGYLGYHFIRVGENYDDFDERYNNPCEYVDYSRKLSFYYDDIDYKELADNLIDNFCDVNGVYECARLLLDMGYTEKQLKTLRFDDEAIKRGKEIEW